MLKLLSGAIGILGRALVALSKALYRPPEERRVLKWLAVHGDKTLRLDYDLDETSVVFDVGGYEGQWASDIVAKYACAVWVFEPVSEFADAITRRFQKNARVRVFGHGLAGRTQNAQIAIASDSSSVYREGAKRDISLVDIVDFMTSHHVYRIDLLKLNVEGGEYELLERLISSGTIAAIDNIQVQFHDVLPDSRNRMEAIQRALGRTHRPTYQFDFVWENWRRV